MANDFSRAIWKVDSVMPTPIQQVVFIENIAWTDFGQADSLVILDASGGTILDTKTTAANTSNYQNFPVKVKAHGLQVTTLTAGGKVFIYTK